MRISDFGLLDPDSDPDCHQNWTHWSLGHALPLQKISSKSVHNFLSVIWRTDKQTDRSETITSFGGGNKKTTKCTKENTSEHSNMLTSSTYCIRIIIVQSCTGCQVWQVRNLAFHGNLNKSDSSQIPSQIYQTSVQQPCVQLIIQIQI